MTKEEYKKYINDNRNKIKRCPICNSNICDRQIVIYKELMYALWKIYLYCKESKKYYFKIKEIKHMLDKNNYARISDLCKFGGLVFKVSKGNYGLNMDRCCRFFKGEYKIPVQITINQITGEIVNKEEVDIKHFPELYKLLNPDGLYDPKMNFNYK
jgi:hypothetical protein